MIKRLDKKLYQLLPAPIKKLDHWMLTHMPLLWSTRIILILVAGAVFFSLTYAIVMAGSMEVGSLFDPMVLAVIGIILGSIGLVWWYLLQDRYDTRKDHAYTNKFDDLRYTIVFFIITAVFLGMALGPALFYGYRVSSLLYDDDRSDFYEELHQDVDSFRVYAGRRVLSSYDLKSTAENLRYEMRQNKYLEMEVAAPERPVHAIEEAEAVEEAHYDEQVQQSTSKSYNIFREWAYAHQTIPEEAFIDHFVFEGKRYPRFDGFPSAQLYTFKEQGASLVYEGSDNDLNVVSARISELEYARADANRLGDVRRSALLRREISHLMEREHALENQRQARNAIRDLYYSGDGERHWVKLDSSELVMLPFSQFVRIALLAPLAKDFFDDRSNSWRALQNDTSLSLTEQLAFIEKLIIIAEVEEMLPSGNDLPVSKMFAVVITVSLTYYLLLIISVVSLFSIKKFLGGFLGSAVLGSVLVAGYVLPMEEWLNVDDDIYIPIGILLSIILLSFIQIKLLRAKFCGKGVLFQWQFLVYLSPCLVSLILVYWVDEFRPEETGTVLAIFPIVAILYFLIVTPFQRKLLYKLFSLPK